jgi:hypothetical protein
MRTPAGFECKYFYGDYFRGRSVEECRLLQASGQKWSADLCKTCSAPGIARANACENLVLRGSIKRPFSAAFMRRVEISAYCEKSNVDVREPHIGCGNCHPISDLFEVKK